MIKAIMNGCNGKMGQVISAICKEDPQIEIVAGVDLYDGIKNDYPVFPNISVCDVKADVIIDFPMRRPWTIFWSIVWIKRFRWFCARRDCRRNRWSR